MVVSGINDGANLGDDVLYSGTVAAAIEGRFLGLPAIAVSLVIEAESGQHFETAARVAAELVMRVQRTPLHQATILNVNVPDLPYEKLQGYQATRLGFRHRSERIVRSRGSARTTDLLGGACGRRAGCGSGHGFPRRCEWLCLGHAAADRPDASRDDRGSARMAARARLMIACNASGAAESRRHRHDLSANARATRAKAARAGNRDAQVLDQIRNVPRHLFVDEALATRAYEDTALPIGYGQTISQPYRGCTHDGGADRWHAAA